MNKPSVNKSIRLMNFLIDYTVCNIAISIVLALFFYDFHRANLTLDASKSNLFFMAGIAFYYIFCEYFFQKTIGKIITKTKVLRTDNCKPNFFNVLIRTLCRFTPI
jgi:uncharacterized RDD family membrane protein YckC